MPDMNDPGYDNTIMTPASRFESGLLLEQQMISGASSQQMPSGIKVPQVYQVRAISFKKRGFGKKIILGGWGAS